MKKIVLILFLLFIFVPNCLAATEFICTINKTGEDYNTLTLWEAAMDNAGDITASDCKVFAISSVTTDFVDTETATGQSSGATATVIHQNNADTQILLDGITNGPFISGEQITGSTAGDLVLGDAGDSVIIVAECYDDQGDLEDPGLVFDGLTTSATNYMIVRAAPGEGHDGTPGTGFLWKNTTVDNNCTGIADDYVVFDGLEIFQNYGSSSERRGILVYTGTTNVTIKNCIVKTLNSGSGMGRGILATGAEDNLMIVNTLAYECKTTGIFIAALDGKKNYAYNCTAVDNGVYGFEMYAIAGNTTGEIVLTNCLGHGSGTSDFVDTAAGSVINTVNYCASEDATANTWGGTGNRNSQTFTFVDSNNDDYHLQRSDGGARNYGDDLSADSFYAFDDDIDDSLRAGDGWDIGADEYTESVMRNAVIRNAVIN